ncbi:MAG: hypothetical protein HYS18_13730 [Burkholderiales bacterium]|nr:hypothetical protein [Burkholderiales bacterium]
MASKIRHFMEEADIGSGEKTPAELEDLEKTAHLREDLEKNREHGKPLNGSQLQEVVEEQQFIADHENHTPSSLMDEVGPEHESEFHPHRPPPAASIGPSGQDAPSAGQGNP